MSIRPGEGLGPDFDVTTLNFDAMLELFYIALNGIDERTIRTSIEVSKSLVVQLSIHIHACEILHSKHVEDWLEQPHRTSWRWLRLWDRYHQVLCHLAVHTPLLLCQSQQLGRYHPVCKRMSLMTCCWTL